MTRLLQSGAVQAKLHVSQPGDADENEADRAAQHVVATRPAQQECACGGSCSKCAADQEQRRVPGLQLSSFSSRLQRAAKDASGQPEAVAADPQSQGSTPGLIVDDEATISSPGQMKKSVFFDLLEADICATADAELKAVGRSSQGCPYVQKWLAFYRVQSSRHLEAAILKYAPDTADAVTARDYILHIRRRVRRAVAIWARTGKITGVPPGIGVMPEEPTEQARKGEGFGTGLLRAVAGGRAMKPTGMHPVEVQYKRRPGGDSPAVDAEALQQQLGDGRALDSSVRSRMESAFGRDFSRVRVHDDPAEGLASQLNARAFTIGNNIAFAQGEYRPGTPIGDVLIAHELAHVVQQGAATQPNAPMFKGGGDYDALESDADIAAVGAVARLWGGARGKLADLGQHAMPRLQSGLRLQRCSHDKLAAPDLSEKLAPPEVTDPVSTKRLNEIWRKLDAGQHADYQARITRTASTLYEFETAIDAYLAAQKTRQAEAATRDRLTMKLHGTKELYKQYKQYMAALASELGPDEEETVALKKSLRRYDFKDRLDYKAAIDDYLEAFQTETAKLGLDLVAVYDGMLAQERQRYSNDTNRDALYDALAPFRAEYLEHIRNVTIYSRRQVNEKSKTIPSQGTGTDPAANKITAEEARAAEVAAKVHAEKSKQAYYAVRDRFPILKEDNLPEPRRLNKFKLAQVSRADFRTLLFEHIDARRHDVAKTRETLTDESEKIFTIDNLLASSREQLRIAPGSVFAEIIEDHKHEIVIEEILKNVLIGVFAFALGMLVPGGGWVAAAAATASFGISAVTAYLEYQEFKKQEALYGVGLLSEEPSALWVLVAVAGAVADGAQVLKAMQALKTVRPITSTLKTSEDLTKLSKGLTDLVEKGELEAKIAANVERAAAARVKSAEAATELKAVLSSRLYGLPGPFIDKDVYKQLVKLAYYKVREVGYAFETFVLEIMTARRAARLGELSSEELSALKRAYEEGSSFKSEEDLLKYLGTEKPAPAPLPSAPAAAPPKSVAPPKVPEPVPPQKLPPEPKAPEPPPPEKLPPEEKPVPQPEPKAKEEPEGKPPAEKEQGQPAEGKKESTEKKEGQPQAEPEAKKEAEAKKEPEVKKEPEAKKEPEVKKEPPEPAKPPGEREIEQLRAEEAHLKEERRQKAAELDREDKKLADYEQAEEILQEYEESHPNAKSTDKQLQRLRNKAFEAKANSEAQKKTVQQAKDKVVAMDKRLAEIDAAKKEYYGDKPWRQIPLKDPANPNANNRSALVGELQTASKLKEAKYEPIGDTINPDKVKTIDDFDAALSGRQGIQDIDGVFRRESAGVMDYALVESKTSGDVRGEPSGVGKLETMTTGRGERQMSNDWIDNRLDAKGLPKQDVANIRAGMQKPGTIVEVPQAGGGVKRVRVRKIYSQTDPSGTRMNEISNVSDTEVKIGKSFDPFK
jgi:hypothetical protein